MKRKDATKESMDVRMLPIDSLQPMGENRRAVGTNGEKLKELAASIKATGRVLQPLVVREAERGWEIVAGIRRFTAAKSLGLKTLPCSVVEMGNEEARAARIVENVQREDLHPLDEATEIAELAALVGAEEAAAEIGCSVSHVQRRARLLDLTPGVREAFVSGELNIGHASALCALQPEDQDACLKRVKEHTRWGSDFAAKSLRDLIAQTVLTRLRDAPFKKDDAGLVPEAGACGECMKRSGAQPALFPDVGKDDLCTDPACYNRKLDALVEAQERKLEGKNFKRVVEGWNTGEAAAGVFDSYQWTESKKKDKGAVQCLVTGGSRRGRLTWGVMRGKAATGEETKERKEDIKRKRKLVREEKEYRSRIINDAAEGARESLPASVTRILAVSFFKEIWDNYRRDVCKLYGWERPKKKEGEHFQKGWTDVGIEKVGKFSEEELRPFIVRCLLSSALTVEEYDVSAGRKKSENSDRWRLLVKVAGELGAEIPERGKEK